MDWIKESKRIFKAEKPNHFTNYTHCEECAEHDETLINSSIENIGLEELGNPGWDPLCFCSDEGKKYYMPAFIRLCLETVNDNFYFEQLLFHLEGDGKNNSLVTSCSEEQKDFIASFVKHMIEKHAKEIENYLCEDEALKVFEIWCKA